MVIKMFHKKHPHIRVKMNIIPFNHARRAFMKASMKGKAPDILRCEIAWTPLFASLNMLKPLNNYISKHELLDYLKVPLAYCRYEGQWYGLPNVTDCLVLFYNIRMFKKAKLRIPRTMQEMLTVAKLLTRPAETKDGKHHKARYGIFLRADSYFFQPFLWAFGGGLIEKDKNSGNLRISINNKGSLAALKFFMKLKKTIIPKYHDIAIQHTEGARGFRKGKYAMVINGPWAIYSYLKAGKQFRNIKNLGIAVIPKGPGGYGSPAGGHNWVISKKSTKVKESLKFIRFLNRPEIQALFAKRNKLLPTRISAYRHNSIKKDYIMQQFLKQLKLSRNRPVIPKGAHIYSSFTQYFQSVYQGSMSPKIALGKITKAWKKLFKIED